MARKLIVRKPTTEPLDDVDELRRTYKEEPIVSYKSMPSGIGEKTPAGAALERFTAILETHPVLIHDKEVRSQVESIAESSARIRARALFACLQWLEDPANHGTWATRSLWLLTDCFRYAAYLYYHDLDSITRIGTVLLTDATFDRLHRFCVVNRPALRAAGIMPDTIAEHELVPATACELRVKKGSDEAAYRAVLDLLYEGARRVEPKPKKILKRKRLQK